MDRTSTKKLGSKIGLVVGIVVLIVLGCGIVFRFKIADGHDIEAFPISWFIIVAAILGSLVNQSSRAGEFQHVSFGWVVGFLFWKSTVSIVFAFMLYLMFISGLISGDMFPQFVNTTTADGGKYENMIKFCTLVDPKSYKDVAKLLVWSFIAGYSERFVPNLIEQIHRASQGNERN